VGGKSNQGMDVHIPRDWCRFACGRGEGSSQDKHHRTLGARSQKGVRGAVVSLGTGELPGPRL